MRRGAVEVVSWVVAFAVGAFVGLFSAGPALFADGSDSARIGILVVTAGLYLVLSVGLGLFAPEGWKMTALLLATPVIPVAALFGREIPLLAGAFVLNAFATSLFGAWLGSRLRARRGSSL